MAKFRTPLLVLLLLGLVLLVWLDNRSDDQTTTTADSSSPQVTTTMLRQQGTTAKDTDTAAISIVQRRNPLAALQRRQLHDTTSRPLFSSTRKPPPAQLQSTPRSSRPQTVTEPELDEYALLGVVYGDDKKAIALLRQISSKRNYRVEQGDMVGGWQVINVETTRVTLSKKGKVVILPLPRK